jgi:hypothetical protein
LLDATPKLLRFDLERCGARCRLLQTLGALPLLLDLGLELGHPRAQHGAIVAVVAHPATFARL